MQNTVTRRRKILFFIPSGIVALCLLYSWVLFATTNYKAVFSHYLGLLLFIPIICLLFKNKTFKKMIVAFGIYLIVATINLVSFLPFVTSNVFRRSIGSFHIRTPGFNGVALLLLILYGILNFDTLVDIYLDYKEAKGTL